MYSGAPIEEQNRYVGERYLPAVAGVRKATGDQRFALTGALNDLNTRRYETAYQVRQKQLDTEAAERAEQARLAAARQAAAASAGGTYKFGGGPPPGPARPAGAGGGPVATANYNGDPNYWQNLINQYRYADGLNRGWGETAQLIEQRFGKIPRGSVADQVFNQVFTGASAQNALGRGLGQLAGLRF